MKKTGVVKELSMGKEHNLLGNTESYTRQVVKETASLISSRHGFKTDIITDCRMSLWYQKTSKARKSAPLLRILLPMQEAFKENIKERYMCLLENGVVVIHTLL